MKLKGLVCCVRRTGGCEKEMDDKCYCVGRCSCVPPAAAASDNTRDMCVRSTTFRPESWSVQEMEAFRRYQRLCVGSKEMLTEEQIELIPKVRSVRVR